MKHSIIEPVSTAPVTLEEAKAQIVVTHALDDELIDSFIVAALDQVERATNVNFGLKTIDLYLDEFPARMFALGVHPVQEVVSINYDDENGDEQTIASDQYRVDTVSLLGRLQTINGWPTVDAARFNSVRIRCKVGYTDATLVPSSVKQAMLLVIAHLYENREGVITGTIAAELPLGVKALLAPYMILPL